MALCILSTPAHSIVLILHKFKSPFPFLSSISPFVCCNKRSEIKRRMRWWEVIAYNRVLCSWQHQKEKNQMKNIEMSYKKISKWPCQEYFKIFPPHTNNINHIININCAPLNTANGHLVIENTSLMANEKGRSILTMLDYRVHHKASKPIRQNFWASLEVEGGEGLWDFVVE